MVKFHKNATRKAGMPPGAILHKEGPMLNIPKVTVFDYDCDTLQETFDIEHEDVLQFKDRSTITWMDVDTLDDVKLIQKICNHYGVSKLTIEDILNTEQRPKIEIFENYMYVVIKVLEYDAKKQELRTEQISMLVGKTFVISFQERPGDCFDAVRNRLRNEKSTIRKEGSDYLLYALMDTIIDFYFGILERGGDVIEEMEDSLLLGGSKFKFDRLYKLKREMILMRKSIWPLREVVGKLYKEDIPLIDQRIKVYFSDVYDHTIQIIDTVETYRDMLAGMVDLYHSTMNSRMNQIMKVLTIISTIFIPLNFIAGVYGMNFKYMPELEWTWGYPIIVSFMLALALVMVTYFRRKKWM